ncbi:discoidin domain-containing protein [Micrococcales bacterium 31B]|nr:discoidin domain-containing protein [Micrococcales bacterium 31B]
MNHRSKTAWRRLLGALTLGAAVAAPLAPGAATRASAQLAQTLATSPAAAASALADPAPPPVAPGAKRATPIVLRGVGGLKVQVAREFPQVIQYVLGGRTLWGQPQVLNTFTINGTNHVAHTNVSAGGNRATYTSTFADLPGLVVTSVLVVNADNTLTYYISKIAGNPAVNQIAIPHHGLLAATSKDAGAQLARTKISTDSTTTADQFVALAADTPSDAAPVGTPYGFVSNGQLAGGIITNATEDAPQDSNLNWNARLFSQVSASANGTRTASLAAGTWTYRPRGAVDARVATYQTPAATVVLSADANQTGGVDWQDGAIAYRAHAPKPLGSDRVADRVVQHIPFNFASQATNPFIKTLDNVKRIAMNTDGLGQWVLEKGYASEGHDSGHPDFGGDINTRAGGLDDFNTLIDEGAEFNADVAVHVNATEAYAQAKSFTDRMVAGQVNGWNWLNQAYHIDQRYDLGSGLVLDRFEQLKAESPNLSGVYVDAYYSSGWLSDGLADQLYGMGLEVATEWAYKFEGTSTWSHWANDKNYGGVTNKGINSNIVRFIANGDRDVWNVDPLLGGADIKEFEGWTGQSDWNRFANNLWVANVPTKFLQHFTVQSWNFGASAQLSDGVAVEMRDGERVITMGGVPVLTGDTYLLPWQSATANEATSPLHADKMYFFSESGGAHAFTLTSQFAGVTDFTLYRLGDQGRVKAADVKATGGAVTLTADPGVPYVLAPAGTPAPLPDAAYGAGSPLTDPGFNAGTLTAWNPDGAVSLERAATGDNVAQIGAGPATLSQKVSGLQPGQRYSFSANVEIQAGSKRAVTLGAGGTQNTFDSTPARNLVGADSKRDTFSQRASVTFVADASGGATVSIGAAAGDAIITLDDARVMADTTTPVDAGVVASADFEGNQPGWGIFVKGDAGGATDPRTSISILHAPYSQQAWKNTHSPFNAGTLAGQAIDDVLDGNASLKAHEENGGLVYRTVPATAQFIDGHRYSVSFDYQNSLVGEYAWITGADQLSVGRGKQPGIVTSTDRITTPIPQALTTTRFNQEFVAGCGDTWVGLRRTGGSGGADFVLDNVKIVDLGESTTSAACATIVAPGTVALNPDAQTEFTTSFTNHETEPVQIAHIGLDGVPADWKLEVAAENGNVFDSVDPGETVTTSWLVTAPAGAEPANVSAVASYYQRCVDKSVSTGIAASVSDRATLLPSLMKATADSENPGGAEGPVANVLDSNPGTIWHTDYTNATDPYPHWVMLDLGAEATVDGFGFLGRQSGGPNGRVKDYVVEVSADGETWREVARGSLVDSPDLQAIDFGSVKATHVRFTALSALNGQPFAAAAEMRVFGQGGEPVRGFEPSPRPVLDCEQPPAN